MLQECGGPAMLDSTPTAEVLIIKAGLLGGVAQYIVWCLCHCLSWKGQSELGASLGTKGEKDPVRFCPIWASSAWTTQEERRIAWLREYC